MKLEELHQEGFTEYIDSEFRVMDHPSGEFALRLVEVNDRMTTPRQEIFSLLFHGPAGFFLPQGIYRLKHGDLGELDLFLVPVGQDQQGFQYEAVFNRLVPQLKKEG